MGTWDAASNDLTHASYTLIAEHTNGSKVIVGVYTGDLADPSVPHADADEMLEDAYAALDATSEFTAVFMGQSYTTSQSYTP